MWRWVYDKNCYVSNIIIWNTWLSFHWVYRPLISALIYVEAYMQGIARHSFEDILVLTEKDLSALSSYLGKVYSFAIKMKFIFQLLLMNDTKNIFPSLLFKNY